MANGDPSNDPTNKTLSTYSSSQAAACVCLMNFNNTVDNVTTDGTTTAPVSSASSSDQDDRFSGISGGQTPTNTLMMTNNSNKIVFSCNNTLGQTTYHNATPDLFTHIVNLYNNKTYTSHLTGKKIGQNNATTTFTNYVFKKTIAENVTNYLDFWECYALANATYLVENKIASVPPAITISHILLTAIVLMLAYMINACMTLTRQRFLRRAIAELPRIKQIFTPSLIKKISNSNYLQIVNEATRARTIGKKIVQHQTHEFQHLGSSFHQKQTYRSMIEFSFHEIEQVLLVATRRNGGKGSGGKGSGGKGREGNTSRERRDSSGNRSGRYSNKKNRSGRSSRSIRSSRYGRHGNKNSTSNDENSFGRRSSKGGRGSRHSNNNDYDTNVPNGVGSGGAFESENGSGSGSAGGGEGRGEPEPLSKQQNQSVRAYLLDVVPSKIDLTHVTQYRHRVETYVRLYEKARFGNGGLNANDLALAMEEVHFIKCVFGAIILL